MNKHMVQTTVALATLIGSAWLAHAGNTCTWTAAGWSTAPANSDDVIVVASGGNLIWDASLPSTVASWTQAAEYTGIVTFNTIYGSTGFTNFTITSNATLEGGTWTHVANVSEEVNRLSVHVGGNLLISNAKINADSLGYVDVYRVITPGKSSATYDGAGYGGVSGKEGGTTYGSIIAPTNLGSDAAANGGGAILLTVAGTTTMATGSEIRAIGGSGRSGGGSGGSVFLTTGWLTGSGLITAQGGAGHTGQGGAGGGGRVAIVLTGVGSDFSWSGSATAYGGIGKYNGAAGTVYLKTASGESTLIVDNNNIAVTYDRATTLMPAGVDLHSFSKIVIDHQGVLGVNTDTVLDFNTLNMAGITNGYANSCITLYGDTGVTYPTDWTIADYTLRGEGISKSLNNVLVGSGGVLSHSANVITTIELYKLNLTLAGNLTVLSNGTINVNYKGFSATKGPGYARVGTHYAGASHGGLTSVDGGGTYGSILSPINLGSGGLAGAGGGAAVLTVAGTTTIAAGGTIQANGQYVKDSAGGSGGSLFLTTGWLAGSGGLTANGGNGGSGQGGAGGGGRIAVILTGAGSGFGTWGGSNTVYGGQGAYKAAAGTLYKRTAAEAVGAGAIMIDNGNIATNVSFTCLPAFTNSAEDLSKTVWTVQNKGKIGLLTNAVIDSLTLNANSYIDLAGYTLTTKSLTITNLLHKAGSYTAAELGVLVSDSSGGVGRVFLNPDQGTCISIR